MNEQKIVKEKFGFLTTKGFEFLGIERSNIHFSFGYQKEDIIIILGYDYREDRFDVFLCDMNNNNIKSLYENIIYTEIGCPESRNKLKTSVKEIISRTKHTHGLPQNTFTAIVDLYSNFVQDHLEEILNWRYDQ